MAKENPKVSLEAVEKQEHFVKYAKRNAKENKIEYKLYESDFLELQLSCKYDYIISNPPFYPAGVRQSEDSVLKHARYSSSLPMEPFFKKVSQLLNPHSHFIFCYDPLAFGDICVALSSVKMRVVDVQFIHSKAQKSASLVMVHARNGSKSMMQVLPPFITFNEAGVYTQKAQSIFKNFKTESIKCQL